MDNKKRIKTPCGTRDFNPEEVYLRQDLFKRIKTLFEKYGGLPIETPVIECIDTVKNLYGEEFNKLVYTLEDKKNDNQDDDQDDDQDNNQSEKLLLRYDLTVPFARYVANNGLVNFKRYQIGKVYRKDNPQISRGRYREFYQSDFDIIGKQSAPMLQETEILQLLVEILENILGPDSFSIVLNSRNILYYVLNRCSIPEQLYNVVCTTLDKLDKVPEESHIEFISNELEKKGVSKVSIDEINQFIEKIKKSNLTSPDSILELLYGFDYIDIDNRSQLDLLFQYLQDCNVYKYIKFDPTLARGLDYYTGIIYEVVYVDKNIMPSSIAAGGRYNNMLSKLSNKGEIPAIGISIGIERIVTILENKSNPIKIPRPDVYVATIGKNMVRERLKLCLELRKMGLFCDMSYSTNPKMRPQFKLVFEQQIPFMIIIGENEIKKNTVTLKDINAHTQVEMNRKDAIYCILSKLNKKI